MRTNDHAPASRTSWRSVEDEARTAAYVRAKRNYRGSISTRNTASPPGVVTREFENGRRSDYLPTGDLRFDCHLSEQLAAPHRRRRTRSASGSGLRGAAGPGGQFNHRPRPARTDGASPVLRRTNRGDSRGRSKNWREMCSARSFSRSCFEQLPLDDARCRHWQMGTSRGAHARAYEPECRSRFAVERRVGAAAIAEPCDARCSDALPRPAREVFVDDGSPGHAPSNFAPSGEEDTRSRAVSLSRNFRPPSGRESAIDHGPASVVAHGRHLQDSPEAVSAVRWRRSRGVRVVYALNETERRFVLRTVTTCSYR